MVYIKYSIIASQVDDLFLFEAPRDGASPAYYALNRHKYFIIYEFNYHWYDKLCALTVGRKDGSRNDQYSINDHIRTERSAECSAARRPLEASRSDFQKFRLYV